MSLHIYIAHTGEHFLADPVSFASYVGLFPLSCFYPCIDLPYFHLALD